MRKTKKEKELQNKIDDIFDSVFCPKNTPYKTYSTKMLTDDIKIAIKFALEKKEEKTMSNETNEQQEGKQQPYAEITEYEVQAWCSIPMSDATLSRLTEILNGEYSIEDARHDILSFRKTE